MIELKLGIMQPYFFPYLPYFSLIAHTDRWVIFDNAQYSRRSWANRNRILNAQNEPQYITVPVGSVGHFQPILEAKVVDSQTALKNILNRLKVYAKRAPFYSEVVDLVTSTFEATETDFLVDLNEKSLSAVCNYLGLRFDSIRASELSLDQSLVHHAGQWAIEISKHLGASDYINPIGGANLFIQKEFEENRIKLSFLEMTPFEFKVSPPAKCVFGLSILDVLMWSAPEDVLRRIFEKSRIVSAAAMATSDVTTKCDARFASNTPSRVATTIRDSV